jgi:CRP-like cAMP-binding protein
MNCEYLIMNDSLIEKVISICQKRPSERTPSDIDILFDLTKNCKVFKTIIEENGITSHIICCKYLHHQFFLKDSYVFRMGDPGSRFFIIIQGKVAVEVLRKSSKGEEEFEEIVELGPGSAFGELALESDKPRSASIKCKEDSHFIYLEKQDYVALISKLIQRRRENNVNFLQKLPALATCTRGMLTKLTYALSEKVFNKGQVVYLEGQPAQEIFLIKKGEFEFYKQISAENSGNLKKKTKNKQKNFKIASYGLGEMFGEEDTLQNKPRNNSCLCVQDKSVLMVIGKNVKNRQDFFKQLKQHQDLIEIVLKRMKDKIRDFNKRTEMRIFVENIPNDLRNKRKKTSICEDLEKDLSQKIRVYCSISSETSLGNTCNSHESSKNRYSNRKLHFSSKTVSASMKNCRNIIEKLAKSDKFFPQPQMRREFKVLEGFTVTSLPKLDLKEKCYKPFRTHQS